MTALDELFRFILNLTPEQADKIVANLDCLKLAMESELKAA